MDLGLEGKRAWVTGASSGLGLATARVLVAEGAAVAISARPGPRLEAVVAGLDGPGRAVAVPLDMTDHAAIPRAAEAVVEVLGGLDVAIGNGGGPPPTSVLDLGLEGLDAAYALLLRPAYAFLAATVPAMPHGGVIGFVTSGSVAEPIAGLVASNVMRAAVTSLAKTAATELGPRGFRVLCFAPGRIATDRLTSLDAGAAAARGVPVDEVRAASAASIPLQRYGDPAEFGRAVAFCCSPAASYLTGTTISVDGGAPRSLLA